MYGCLDQYTCRRLRLWNNRDCEMVLVYKYMQVMETMKQSGPWSSLGTHGSLVVMWWLCISSSSETRNVYFLKLNLTLQIKVNCLPGQSRSLYMCVRLLHIGSKFGDPSLNTPWVMVWTSSGLTHRWTDWQTNAGNNNTWRPNWLWVKMSLNITLFILLLAFLLSK